MTVETLANMCITCQRMVLSRKGEIVFDGTAEELMNGSHKQLTDMDILNFRMVDNSVNLVCATKYDIRNSRKNNDHK